MRISARLAGAGLLATAVGVAAGCGSSGSQYIQNDAYGVYARIPSDWRVYDEEDIFSDLSSIEREAQSQGMWIRQFDAADQPSVDHVGAAGTAEPTGNVQVLQLPARARDQMSLSALRGLGDPNRDPVALAGQDPNYGILANEPITFDGGFHGVHTVFTVKTVTDEGEATTVFDRTAVLDATTEVAYLFQVTCDPQCYFETHKDEIADVVDSWTIQEVQS
jgi:hypothetical protein